MKKLFLDEWRMWDIDISATIKTAILDLNKSHIEPREFMLEHPKQHNQRIKAIRCKGRNLLRKVNKK